MTQRLEGNRAVVSTAQACEATNFTSAYIQRLLRDGRIEGVKLGRDWLIYEDSLEAFMTQTRKRGRPHKEAARHEIKSDNKQIESADNAKKQETQTAQPLSTE